MPNAKLWWQSRTLWFNVLTLGVTGAGLLLDPALTLDPRITVGATAVITIGNMVLRLLTNQPIAGTPADAAQATRDVEK